MNIRIEYCVVWNYEPTALSLREELGYEFMNAFIEITSGARGAFEVYVDDVLIFSKLKLDRFPNDGEVVQLIRSK